MKKYTFKVVVYEGCDEFWESLEEEGKTGCDEITGEVKDLIESGGAFHIGGQNPNCELTLIKYEDNGN